MKGLRQLMLLGAIVSLAALPSCGGDGGGGGGGATVMSGQLILPPDSQCPGCSTANRSLSVFALQENVNGTTTPPIITITSDAQGNYDTGAIDAQLGGQEHVVMVGSVGVGALGGVEDLSPGDNNVKVFDLKTQIACVASVLVTAGTPAGLNCSVVEGCNATPQAPCFDTISPNLLDNARIANLENAANTLAPQVNLQNASQVARAACQVINCTLAGAGAASAECLAAFAG